MKFLSEIIKGFFSRTNFMQIYFYQMIVCKSSLASASSTENYCVQSKDRVHNY